MLPGNRGLTAPSTRTIMVKTRHIFWVPLISTHIRFSNYLRHRHKTVYRTCVERMNPNNFWKMKPVKKYENCMLTGSVGSQVRIVASCGASMYVKPCKRLVHPNAGTTDWFFFIFFSWIMRGGDCRSFSTDLRNMQLHCVSLWPPHNRNHYAGRAKAQAKNKKNIQNRRPTAQKVGSQTFFKIW